MRLAGLSSFIKAALTASDFFAAAAAGTETESAKAIAPKHNKNKIEEANFENEEIVGLTGDFFIVGQNKQIEF